MSSRKFGLNLVVVLAIAALFTGFWALINRPVTTPNWPEQISGFSYSPFQQGQFPQKEQYPNDDQMRRDLEIMSKLTDNIRTYSVDGTLQDIPKLAEEFGLRVTLGIWISPDQERNEREITRAIEIANSSRSVVRVVVGNEAIFRKEITAAELSVLLDRVRAAVKVPVTTGQRLPGRVAITQGLSEGDVVITAGQAKPMFFEGAPVMVLPAEGEAPQQAGGAPADEPADESAAPADAG